MPRFRPINGSSSATFENVETRENSLTDQDHSVDQLLDGIKRVRFAQNYHSWEGRRDSVKCNLKIIKRSVKLPIVIIRQQQKNIKYKLLI
jgi:hypothetical protein